MNPPYAPQQRRHNPLLIGCLVLVGLGVLTFAGCGVLIAVGVGKATSPSTAPRPAGAAKAARAGVGQSAGDGKFTFTVTATKTATEVGGQFGKKAQGRFFLVYLTVRNHGDQARTLDAGDQKLLAGGKTYSADEEAVILMSSKAFVNQINPGNTVRAVVPFDIPTTVHPTAIELHDSPFSGGVQIALG